MLCGAKPRCPSNHWVRSAHKCPDYNRSMSTPQTSSAVTIRRARPEDAPECARICFDAFYKINTDHNFPPEMPERGMPAGLLGMMFSAVQALHPSTG